VVRDAILGKGGDGVRRVEGGFRGVEGESTEAVGISTRRAPALSTKRPRGGPACDAPRVDRNPIVLSTRNCAGSVPFRKALFFSRMLQTRKRYLAAGEMVCKYLVTLIVDWPCHAPPSAFPPTRHARLDACVALAC
jgi:hypothetical protein